MEKGKFEISSEDMATIERNVVRSVREALTHLMYVEERSFRAFISSLREQRAFHFTLPLNNPSETLVISFRSWFIDETEKDG